MSRLPSRACEYRLGDDSFTTSPTGTPPSPEDEHGESSGQHLPGVASGMPTSEFHPSYPDFPFDSSRCDSVRRKCRELCYNSGTAGRLAVDMSIKQLLSSCYDYLDYYLVMITLK